MKSYQGFYQRLGDRLPPAGWQDIQWVDPGGWQVLNVTLADHVGEDLTILPNDASIDAAAGLKKIIESTMGRRVLYFPAGTYFFASKLFIKTGDLIIRGVGLDKTEFRFTAVGNDAGIEFTGPEQGDETAVSDLPKRGDNTFSVEGDVCDEGDFLLLFNKGSDDTPAGYVDWRPFAEDVFYTQCQIVRVLASEAQGQSQKLTVDMKLGLDFDNHPRFRKLTMLQNVGVEGVKVSLADISGD